MTEIETDGQGHGSRMFGSVGGFQRHVTSQDVTGSLWLMVDTVDASPSSMFNLQSKLLSGWSNFGTMGTNKIIISRVS